MSTVILPVHRDYLLFPTSSPSGLRPLLFCGSLLMQRFVHHLVQEIHQ